MNGKYPNIFFCCYKTDKARIGWDTKKKFPLQNFIKKFSQKMNKQKI